MENESVKSRDDSVKRSRIGISRDNTKGSSDDGEGGSNRSKARLLDYPEKYKRRESLPRKNKSVGHTGARQSFTPSGKKKSSISNLDGNEKGRVVRSSKKERKRDKKGRFKRGKPEGKVLLRTGKTSTSSEAKKRIASSMKNTGKRTDKYNEPKKRGKKASKKKRLRRAGKKYGGRISKRARRYGKGLERLSKRAGGAAKRSARKRLNNARRSRWERKENDRRAKQAGRYYARRDKEYDRTYVGGRRRRYSR